MKPNVFSNLIFRLYATCNAFNISWYRRRFVRICRPINNGKKRGANQSYQYNIRCVVSPVPAHCVYWFIYQRYEDMVHCDVCDVCVFFIYLFHGFTGWVLQNSKYNTYKLIYSTNYCAYRDCKKLNAPKHSGRFSTKLIFCFVKLSVNRFFYSIMWILWTIMTQVFLMQAFFVLWFSLMSFVSKLYLCRCSRLHYIWMI